MSKVGRPRAFESADDLYERALEYFYPDGLDGGLISEPTMAGLRVHLGISKDTWSKYASGERGEEFTDPIKRLKELVECAVERRLLYGTQATGAIFWLKNNAGYRDVREMEHGARDNQPIPVQFTALDRSLA